MDSTNSAKPSSLFVAKHCAELPIPRGAALTLQTSQERKPSHLKIDAIPGSTQVLWTLFRDGKPVATDTADNKRQAMAAAREAFAKTLGAVFDNTPVSTGA